MCLARRCLLPLLPPREERAGERRAVQPAGAAVCRSGMGPPPPPPPPPLPPWRGGGGGGGGGGPVQPAGAAVCRSGMPLSPTLSPFVPHGERESNSRAKHI